jgi:tetratricopeptide (TPR) repeat protein
VGGAPSASTDKPVVPVAVGFEAMGRSDKDPSAVAEAVRVFDAALARDPNDPEAIFGLAWANHKRGKPREAELGYRRAALFATEKNVAPEARYYSHYNLGLLLAEQGRLDAALGEFREAATGKPDSWPPWYHLGDLYARIEAWPSALHALTAAAKLNPSNGDVIYSLGLAHWKMGHQAEAESLFGAALKMKPALKAEYDRIHGVATPTP